MPGWRVVDASGHVLMRAPTELDALQLLNSYTKAGILARVEQEQGGASSMAGMYRASDQRDAYQAGASVAEALFNVVQVQADATPGSFTQLGVLFAQYEGFSDFKAGAAFLQGFTDSAARLRPSQLTSGGASGDTGASDGSVS